MMRSMRPAQPSTSRLACRFRALSMLSVVAAAVAAPACKSAADKPHDPAPIPGDLHLTEGGLSLTTDAGYVALGGDAKVPPDFPKAVPLYPGVKVGMATGAAKGGKPTWTLALETGDEREKVVQFYAAQMTGFTKASDLSLGDTQMTIWQSPKYDVTMMVASGATGETTIAVTVASK
jgi:hypothetical protein